MHDESNEEGECDRREVSGGVDERRVWSKRYGCGRREAAAVKEEWL